MNDLKNSALPLVFTSSPLARLRTWNGLTARLMLCVAALGFDFLLVPSLYNGSTLLFVVVLLALIFVRSRGANAAEELRLSGITRRQALIFAASHAAILFVAHFFDGQLTALRQGGAVLGAAALSMKLLPLLPGIALFPRNEWRNLTRSYRAELMAATIVLFTFLPYRQFQLVWPWYSQALGKVVWLLSLPFLPDAIYLFDAYPIVVGPKLVVHIVFECSGIEGVTLFDWLFGMVAVLGWNRLNKSRLLAGYAIGLAAILAANVVRILLIVVLGNLYWPAIGESSFHIHAGWVFFALVFTAFLYCTYGWMHRRPKPKAS